MKILIFILRALLAFVFILAAVMKARSEPDAPQTLYDAWLAPGSVAHYAFIAFEFLLAMWLLSGSRPRLSATAAALVLGVFTVALWRESRQYDPRPCGCLGGGTVQPVTPDDVRASLHGAMARNLVLMAVAGWLLLLGDLTPRRKPPAQTDEAPAPTDAPAAPPPGDSLAK